MSRPETEPVIRPLSISDIDAVAALYCHVFNAPPWNDAWSHGLAMLRLTDAFNTPGALALGLYQNGLLLGALIGHEEQWFDRREFYLQEIFIHPDHQRYGWGTRLLDQLKARLRAEVVANVTLVTMRESPAADFYTKHGFQASTRMGLMTCRLNDQEAPEA